MAQLRRSIAQVKGKLQLGALPLAGRLVRDGNYVSARWPGDAHTFARLFANVLTEHRAQESTAATAC
jgi:hypothetical protein